LIKQAVSPADRSIATADALRESLEVDELVEDFLDDAGIRLDQPKSVSFNPRTGYLFVETVAEDFDANRQAIEILYSYAHSDEPVQKAPIPPPPSPFL
jgi:hypothetical protein